MRQYALVLFQRDARTYPATFSHESVIHQMLANAFTRVGEEVFENKRWTKQI